MSDAVVVPGGRFGPAVPLLMYAGGVAERRGATVHRHEWSALPSDLFAPGIENWVSGELAPRLDAVGGVPLLIAKSLGTNAAALAAGRSLPAVWLTPLLTTPWVAAALGRATAPFLLVGGTADPVWDSALAHRLTPHLLEVEQANHGMYVPGPLTDSIALLARIVTRVEEFLDQIGWPEAGPLDRLRATGSVEPASTDLAELPEPVSLPVGDEPASSVLARLRHDER